jgi:hypothetical protein
MCGRRVDRAADDARVSSTDAPVTPAMSFTRLLTRQHLGCGAGAKCAFAKIMRLRPLASTILAIW